MINEDIIEFINDVFDETTLAYLALGLFSDTEEFDEYFDLGGNYEY